MIRSEDDQSKRRKRMERIDAMPPDIRACVHEYGLTVVDALMNVGVTKARQIHHVVAVIREGSYQGAGDGKNIRLAHEARERA